MKTIWFAFVLIAAAPGVAVAQTMVSTCNTTFSGAGILTQDLVCAGTAAAVVVETSGSLDMNGFTITAPNAIACGTTIPCRIFSSGTPGKVISAGGGFYGVTQGSSFEGMIVENLEVRGFHTCINSHTLVLRNSRISDCVRGLYAVRGYVEESTITGNSDSGIMGGSISIADSQIRNNGNHGVSCGRVPRIRNSSVSDNVASGIAASTVNKIESSEFRGNGLHGVSSGFEVVKILDSQFEDNGGSGVRGFRSIKAKNSSFSNNDGSGISQFDNGFVPSPGMILQGSVIAGNGLDGISQTATHRRLTLKDTVVTSNGLDAACGVSVACADVTSAVEPDLRGEATCGSSHVHASGLPGENWGVCSGD